MSLFELDPIDTPEPAPKLSAGAKLTARNKAMIERGKHPATYLPLAGNGKTCGDCVHERHYVYHNQSLHKCVKHRLGESHSAASDIRVSWPACQLWGPK